MSGKEKKPKELIDLINELADGKQLHDIQSWPALDESEKQILNKVRQIQTHEKKRFRIYMGAILVVSLCVFSFLLYLYFYVDETSVSYSILPGNIREIKLKYGNAWVNGNSSVEVQGDSLIHLTRGHIFLKKEVGGKLKSYTVTSGDNKIVLQAGNVNIITLDETNRITSLGEVEVITSKDTLALKYGQELRRDSSEISIRTLQSPELSGSFRFGKIAFENEKVEFVIKQLQDFYNIKIEYRILPEIIVSMVARREEDPLKVIKQTLPPTWSVTIRDNVYRIVPPGAHPD